jgi:hypothetical protein
MNLRQLINKSVYGTIGYISSQEDLDILEQYIICNLPVLKEFKRIAVFTNYKDYSGTGLILKNNQLWTKYFPNCVYINNPTNRGHNFGTADLDNLAVKYCKLMEKEWLCKGSNDIIFQELILDKEIEDADFYYLNGIGFGGMVKYDFNFDRISSGYDPSQSTKYEFTPGSILDVTQKLVDAGNQSPNKLEHVGNAINQVSKVFNDGYQELTKGSRVIRYTTKNSVPGGAVEGLEYCRVFTKDRPYYTFDELQKPDGNIRKYTNKSL